MMKVYVRLFFLLIFLHSVIGFAPSLGLSQESDCDCYDFQGNIVERAPTQPQGKPLRGIADIHTHMFANLAYGGATFWGAPFHEDGIEKALAPCNWTDQFKTRGILGDVSTLHWPLHNNYVVHGPYFWIGIPPFVPPHRFTQFEYSPFFAAEDGPGFGSLLGLPMDIEHDVHGYPSFQGWPKRYHQAEVDVRQCSLVLKVA